MCAGGIAADGFRAASYLADRLGQLHQQRPTTGEHGEEDEEEREEGDGLSEDERRSLHIESIRAMLLIGQHHPAVFQVIAQSLARWLTPDLTIRGNSPAAAASRGANRRFLLKHASPSSR
jgi:hypothetical protein